MTFCSWWNVLCIGIVGWNELVVGTTPGIMLGLPGMKVDGGGIPIGGA